MLALFTRVRVWRLFILPLAWSACVVLQAHGETKPSCDLRYEVTPEYGSRPRSLLVKLTFPAEGRGETVLVVNEGWAGETNLSLSLSKWLGGDESTQVEPTASPERIRVMHRTDGVATVTYHAGASLTDPDAPEPHAATEAYRTQIGKDWFQFFGYSVFPTPEVRDNDRQAVVCFAVVQPRLDSPSVFGSNVHDYGNEVAWHMTGTRRQILHAFYGGGTGWRWLERPLTIGRLHLALRGRLDFDEAELADRMAPLIDSHRRFWQDGGAGDENYFVTPNQGASFNSGTVVEGATVLDVNDQFTPTSDSFQFLVGHENLHQWIPRRLGAPGGDGTTYWLSEGFTDYYTHRLLLASGLWSREQYAAALTKMLRRYWQSPTRNEKVTSLAARFFSDRAAADQLYARGEMLAMRWDLALRNAGQPGLDAVLRSLLLPVGSDPRKAIPATERLLAALAPALGTTPADDVQRYASGGADFPLAESLAGPCFRVFWEDAGPSTRALGPGTINALPVVEVLPTGGGLRCGR